MDQTSKLAIFDLDGTLNQTHLYSVLCQRKALARYGINDVSDEDLLGAIGYPWFEYIQRLLPHLDEQGVKDYENSLLEYDRELIPKLAKTYDGTEESLKKLKEDGWLIAICSNASIDYLELVLHSIGLNPYINKVQPLADYKNKSQALQALLSFYTPCRAVMVGDTSFDQAAAKDCGIPFVGCLYGYSPKGVEQADVLIGSAHEIFDAVTSLH